MMATSGIRIVHNKLLGGWYVVRGPHHTPLSGRFDSREAAAQSLIDAANRRDAATIRKNPRRASKAYDYAALLSDIEKKGFQHPASNHPGASGAPQRAADKYRQRPSAVEFLPGFPYHVEIKNTVSKKWMYWSDHKTLDEAKAQAKLFASKMSLPVRVVWE